MKKRLLALTVAMIMTASSLVACGETTDTTTTDDATTTEDAATDDAEATDDAATEEVVDTTVDETYEATEAAEGLACPDVSTWDESKKIYFYSWNDEFGSRMQYVLDAYPELSDYVEYVNLACSGTDGTYETSIEDLITSNDEKFPSIIAADNDVAKSLMTSEKFNVIPVSDLGITDEMYANAYNYTKDYATIDGKLMALTWQACPGSFLYRTDIAEEVLGASDPETVQAAIADWDKFFETADKMKEAGYAMVAGPDELKYACFDQQTSSWITADADGNESLTLDSSVDTYFELSKKLADGGYTNNASMWSAAWNAGYEGKESASDDEGEVVASGLKPVFGYFGCTWSAYWCMTFDDADNGYAASNTYGKWNLCAGPVSYHWGGTYCMVVEGTPNQELAAFLVYSLCCDEDVMYTLACDTKDFVNNKAVIEKEIANGDGTDDRFAEGVNPIAVWSESVKDVNLKNASYADAKIKDCLTNAATAYNSGTVASIDDAKAAAEKEIRATYDYLQ